MSIEAIDLLLPDSDLTQRFSIPGGPNKLYCLSIYLNNGMKYEMQNLSWMQANTLVNHMETRDDYIHYTTNHTIGINPKAISTYRLEMQEDG